MRVSLSLLQTFFSSPLSLKQILSACDRIGIETEIEDAFLGSLSSVVTAKVLDTQKHPNADTLVVATVFDGTAEHQIVCGAPNCRPGIIIPLALPGAKLRNAEGEILTITKSKIRGIESRGMCCGADELGFPHLQKSERGLFEFPEDTPLGESACSLLAGAFIECSLTPNLGHCASLLGLAREIACVSGVDLVLPEPFSCLPVPSQYEDLGTHDDQASPFFCSVHISGVDNRPSPQKIQEALFALKQKPINALVDITNYVMLSLGQPLHAYDARYVQKDSIRAEKLQEPSELTLLNKETVSLPEGTLVIRDDAHILGLAGIMGGAVSSVDEETTEIILESAYFLPQAIRSLQKHLPIHSEAGYRFARGTDPQQVLPALYAAIHLIQDLFPEARVSLIRKLGNEEQPLRAVHLRENTTQRILGESITLEDAEISLSQLGFPVTREEDSLCVTVPSYRHDIKEEIDLVEELYRSRDWKVRSAKHQPAYPPMYKLKRGLTDHLVHAGLQQFFTCDLLDPETASLSLQETELLALQGSKQATALRNSLLPGLIKSVAININRKAPYVHAFEIGTVYSRNKEPKRGKHYSAYREQESLGIILSGQSEPLSWENTRSSLSFYSIKGWVETVLRYIGISIDDCLVTPSESENFHPYQQAQLSYNKQCIGLLGTLHPDLCKKAQIKQQVFFAELLLNPLLGSLKTAPAEYAPYPVYPSSFRDITLTVNEDIPAGLLRKKLLSYPSKWLERVVIISVYQDKSASTTNKNVSLRLLFRDMTRTLSNQEIDAEHERLLTLLNQEIDPK